MQLQLLMQVLSKQSWRNLRLYDHRLFCIAESFLAGGASMALAVVFDHFTGGRNEFQFPADIFLADQDHLRTTYRTDLILFRKWDHYFFNFQAFEEFLMCCLLLRVCSRITVSPSNRDGSCSTSASSKRFCCPGISSDLLSLEGPKSFLSDNLPVPEELSHDWFFVNNKTESFDQFRLLRYHCFQL